MALIKVRSEAGRASTGVYRSLNAAAATGAGDEFDFGFSFSQWAMQTVIAGTVASLTLTLQGSLDGTTWYTLVTSSSTTSEAVFAVDKPARYVRANLTAVTGASPSVTAFLTGTV